MKNFLFRAILIVYALQQIPGSILAQEVRILLFAIESQTIQFESVENRTHSVSIDSEIFPDGQDIQGDGLSKWIFDVPGNIGKPDIVVQDNSGLTQSFSLIPQEARLEFEADPKNAYQIEMSSDLIEWRIVRTVVGRSGIVSESISLPNDDQQFIRIRSELYDDNFQLGQFEGFLLQNRIDDSLVLSGVPILNGFEPVNDVLVSLDGGQLDVLNLENGFVRFPQLETGIHSATFIKGTESQTFSFQAFPNSTTKPNIGIFNHELAINKLLNDLIPTLSTPKETHLILQFPQPIPAGTVVDFSDGKNTNSVSDGEPLSIENDSWFFIVDEYSTTQLGHPIHFVFVNSQTGVLTSVIHGSLPEISGFQLFQDYPPNEPELIFLEPSIEVPVYLGNPEGIELLKQEISNSRTLGGGSTYVPLNGNPLAKKPKVYLMYIEFSNEFAITVGRKRITHALSPDFTHLVSPSQSWDKDYRKGLDKFYKTMQPEDIMVLALAGHGNVHKSGVPWGHIWGGARGGESVGPIFVMKPLKGLPACKLLIYVDVCFAGAFVDTGGFATKSFVRRNMNKGLQVLDVNFNGVDLTGKGYTKITRSMRDYIPEILPDVDVLSIASCAPVHGSLYNKLTGSYFMQESISAGLFTRPIDFQNIQTIVSNLSTDTSNSVSAQGPKSYFDKGDTSKKCPPPCIVEEEPNNSCDETNKMGGAKCAEGSIPQREPGRPQNSPIIGSDYFEKALAPGKYRITIDSEIPTLEIRLPSGLNKARKRNLDFEIVEPEVACISVYSFAPVEKYKFEILEESEYCRTMVDFTNTSEDLIGFRLIGENIEPVPSNTVVLGPGQKFQRVFEKPLEGLNIVNFTVGGELVGETGDLLFDLDIPCGRTQTFKWAGFLQFDQIPFVAPEEDE